MKATMRKMQIIFVSVFLVFFFSAVAEAQTKIFEEAKGSGIRQAYYEFDKWNFSIGESRYEIGKNGRAKRTNAATNRAVNFSVSLDEAENLHRIIYFSDYKGDLILLGELDYGDAGAGFLARIDGKTLKTKWRQSIGGFNVAQGLIEGNSAYLAAVGYAAKINLDTGKFIWKHEDFYRKYKESGAFNIFEVPEIKGNAVIFTEKQGDYKRPPNIIKFNKTSGKIIEVKVN